MSFYKQNTKIETIKLLAHFKQCLLFDVYWKGYSYGTNALMNNARLTALECLNRSLLPPSLSSLKITVM